MATAVRQPFAPLDGARLQALTSTKNRQNAVLPPASKRKAPASWATETDDAENVDPGLFAKRCKATDSCSPLKDGFVKKSAFTLTRAATPASKTILGSTNTSSASPLASSPQSRSVLKPKAPSARLGSSIATNNSSKKSSVSALAALASGSGSSHGGVSGIGRRGTPVRASAPLSSLSPASRRGGILSSSRRRGIAAPHRATSSLSSPPKSNNIGFAAPFSLDAALKGTLSTYESRLATASLPEPTLDASGSWFFDIHEDTPEQEMTNLLQHSTCVLDISSDEETEQKARRERDEGRDKENIPPPNDISQTSLGGAQSARALAACPVNKDDMAVEKARNPLGQLNAADFYASGCDETSVVFVQDDEADAEAEAEFMVAALIDAVVEGEVVREASATVEPAVQEAPLVQEAPAMQVVVSTEAPVDAPVDAAEAIPAALSADPLDGARSVDSIMGCRAAPGAQAAAFEPIDGTGESFQLWESGSTQDDDGASVREASPSPLPHVLS